MGVRDDNKITYLSGIPNGVRTLHVAGNRLTSLTSVDHLRNLQYLDISRNHLDNVTRESTSAQADLRDDTDGE